MITYQLPDMQFDEISDHKHDIYLYGNLSTKLLAQTVCFFQNGSLKYDFRSDCPENSEQRLP